MASAVEKRRSNCALTYDLGFSDGYRAGAEDSWGQGYDTGFREGWIASRTLEEVD